MLPLLRCFFAHLLILQYPDHHQNLISSSLYYSGPVHKISSKSVHNFLSNVVHRQTNKQTRSTQRAHTSLAEADHYSHIAHCKNVEPWLWKTTHPPEKKKVLDHYLHHDLGMLPLLRCFFAHLLILQYPDHHQNLISSSLYYSGPVHKISSQSVHNFLSNVVHRQTDKLTNATKNITSFAKEVIKLPIWLLEVIRPSTYGLIWDLPNSVKKCNQAGRLLKIEMLIFM